MKTLDRFKQHAGFSLIELMITVVVVGILAAIAYPSYTQSIAKTKRRAAEACLSSYATFMERNYTASMRYDKDAAGANIALPDLDCASAQNTGENYTYSLAAVARSTYTISAVPQGAQEQRDAACGTLTLDQTGTRGVSGSAGVDGCW